MMPRLRLRLVLTICAAITLAACGRESAPSSPAKTPPPAKSASAEPAPKQGRLIMLGFDGVDPRWLEKWAAAGKLPHLKRLLEQHEGRGYRHLGSTNPPQSPVAWTSFATGTLPGEHGIFDFIGRSLSASPTGLPIMLRVATTSFEVQPAGPPVARNLRNGIPFWQTLGNAGVRTVTLNVPYSFPPDPMRDGRMLSGLGVPDLRETNSTFTYVGTEVSDEQVRRPPGGGAMVKLALAGGQGSFDLEGPSVPNGNGARMKLPVTVKIDADHMQVTLGAQTISLSPRQWSEFVEVQFAHEGAVIKGVLKLLALEIGKKTRLFITPIGFHPREPYSPLSHPRAFSGQIADDLGRLYKTVGWDHDTSSLNAEVLDDESFLADMAAIEKDRREMLFDRMAKPDWDLLIWVSTATDRVAHMFYRLTDPEHPRYDAALAKRFGDAIEREYVRMDETVGAVLERLSADDTLLILSDHGFHNYRRGLHVNQWLREQGLLALKAGATSSAREFLLDVDWSKTKAYAVGTGQIYINLAGRERDGIVSADEANTIIEQITQGLIALRDTERENAPVVRAVYAGAKVFRGARASEAPDMQVAFAENYRTSWETILGGVPKGLFADNDKKWSGDHAASDVTETAGILVSNRPLSGDTASIVDLAPTAHAFFSKERPAHYTGRALLAPSAP